MYLFIECRPSEAEALMDAVQLDAQAPVCRFQIRVR